jgi:hypothetical protein
MISSSTSQLEGDYLNFQINTSEIILMLSFSFHLLIFRSHIDLNKDCKAELI